MEHRGAVLEKTMERAQAPQSRKPQLHVTTSPEQLAQIKQAAAAEGLSVASFIRQAVLARVSRETAQKGA